LLGDQAFTAGEGGVHDHGLERRVEPGVYVNWGAWALDAQCDIAAIFVECDDLER
jgi:hypothetical protein